MATRKTPPPRKAGAAKAGAKASPPAGQAPAGKPPAGKSTAGKATAGKTTGAAASARPATKAGARKGPAQRPPARRKNKSIVNQKQTPWGLIAAIAAVVVFAAVVIIVVVAQGSGGGSGSSAAGNQILPNTPTGPVTKQHAVARVANTTGVKGVIAYNTAGYPGPGKTSSGTMQHQHVTGPVDYSVLPPAGGPHNATWMNAGVYTKPIPSERAVHNLEHGAVWITYDPDLAPAKVKQLRAFVAKQSFVKESDQASGMSGQENRYMDLSPWSSNALPTPIVMSSWGYQLRLTSPTDPRMQKFVDTFRNSSKYTPEFGSAVDGIPIRTGGRPEYAGSKKANPSGSAD